jgi:hypothetical protein
MLFVHSIRSRLLKNTEQAMLFAKTHERFLGSHISLEAESLHLLSHWAGSRLCSYLLAWFCGTQDLMGFAPTFSITVLHVASASVAGCLTC